MQSRSVATINNILDAARGLFIERQYGEVSLREITQRAGVTKGALYHHFPTKEDLYSRLIHRCLGEVKSALEESLNETRGETARERLRKSMISFLQLPVETRAVMRSIRRNINIFEDPMRAELISAYQEALPGQIEALLEDGIENGEIVQANARLLSWQHVAVVEVTLYLYDRDELGGPEEMAKSVVNLLFDGIALPTTS